ncbi:MAG TPA: amidohydrolase family protein, partial [Candidatus Sulfopaludibacter sp.]|nr:amidohydrolase family protein [Candidatus Sulfopaludibacter sp.]
MRGSLLIRGIHTLVPMDAAGTVLHGASLYIEDGEVRQVLHSGTRLPKAALVIDGRHAIAIPGLVNTHHHLYQTLTRAYGPAADAELFDWLRTLYPVWARLDEDSVRTAALAGMAELMLSGCTTTTDHHYVFPRGRANLIDAQIEAARRIGMRFHPTRGSMSVGRSKGGLPPDSVVQSEDLIL